MELETIDLTLEQVRDMYNGIQQYCFKEDVATSEDAKLIMEPYYGVEIPLELLNQVINGD